MAHADRQVLDQRLQAFIDQGPLTVYVNRPDGASSNVYMSPQLEAILGYTAAEWAADPEFFRKVLHPDDRDWVIAEQRRTKEAGEPFRAEYRMVTNDGSVRWFLDETHEIAGQDDESAYRYGYLVEITERKELEEAVGEAEERYRALVEQLPLAIYIDRLDEVSSNIYTSPQVERMLGYTSEQWATEGDLFVRLLHPDDRDRVLAEHEHARASGEPLRTEYRLLSADGDVIWIRDEAVIVGDRDEGTRLLQGFLLDITERKTAEQALRDSEAELSRQKSYAEELLQLSPVAIVTLDSAEHVLSWNPAAEKLYGYTKEEAVGTHLDDLLFPTEELRQESRAVGALADEQGLAHVISGRARKDGKLVDVEILMVPLVVDGERSGYLVLYHDISELQRARVDAEAATQAKSAFLATMSHEIRTPMNAVIGMGGLLLDTDLTEEQREFAEVIRTSGEALLRIIDDILDYSKIEAGKFELEEHALEVRAFAESALDLVAVRASEKDIELACLVDEDVPAAILGDPTRLRQALGNLLANAVKFTEVGEVDPRRRGRGWRRQRLAAPALLGQGHRHRDPGRENEPPVRVVQPGGRFDDAALRRDRARPRDLATARGVDGRHALGGKRGAEGLDLLPRDPRARDRCARRVRASWTASPRSPASGCSWWTTTPRTGRSSGAWRSPGGCWSRWSSVPPMRSPGSSAAIRSTPPCSTCRCPTWTASNLRARSAAPGTSRPSRFSCSRRSDIWLRPAGPRSSRRSSRSR